MDEGDLLQTVADVVTLLQRERDGHDDGVAIDVLVLSLGYYHETPEDGLYSTTLSDLLRAAREMGCTVVCSAGNDAIDRPTFPASLWAWPGADNGIAQDKAALHVAVGALNPSSDSVALFSNVGPWVTTYAPGAAVVSTTPDFDGGRQAASCDDRYGRHRATLGPDDYRGGFAAWSGTSFAAPYAAGLVAAALGDVAARAERAQRISRARKAARSALETLASHDGSRR